MNRPPIYIHGYGAVSAAGLDASALHQACATSANLPVTEREYPLGDDQDGSVRYRGREVDTKALRALLPKAPRLRRASNVTKFAMAATLQAIPEARREQIKSHDFRLGIIVAFMNGCVNYSCRFFSEVLAEPAHASPLIFPETVFNAPASHIAEHLGADGPVYTLIGDSATWFSALDVARDWMADDHVDGCLILAAEELDRLTSEALSLYSRQLIPTEGAAALYLENCPSDVLLENLHGPYGYTTQPQREAAIAKAVSLLDPTIPLVTGLTGIPKIDQDEQAALKDHTPENQLPPFKTLGEPMGLRAAFQTIHALESLNSSNPRTSILATGGNQQAYSATIAKVPLINPSTKP